MLNELIIRKFAIIDHLQVAFGEGFNVLTGETGAGKSIIIDAVGLLLGDRARPEVIRTGEETATVEALLDLSDHPGLRGELSDAGFEAGDELLVKRVVSRSGRNRIYLNGSLATATQLQAWLPRLLTIYGQHEHQSLQRSGTHLLFLDGFAGVAEELAEYRRHYEEVDDCRRRLAGLDEAERERRQRIDLLSYQSREIGEVDPRIGEDEELAAERALLQNAERLVAATQGGYEALYGTEGAIIERLDGIAGELEGLAEIAPDLGRLAETLRGAFYSIEDVANELRDTSGRITFEPGRQEAVEERMARLTALKRKYAPTLEEVLAFKAAADSQVEELNDVDATRGKLSARMEEASERLRDAGEALTRRRSEAARRLERAVEAELGDLAMAAARFEVRFMPLGEPGLRGFETGEFFIAPNPGEEAKPLGRTASGGELSRLMLALKRAAPEAEVTPTLVFDEVDAGIGGTAATAVGEKLRSVARGRQVLCITHLPQVAAFADRHYRVDKREEEGRTVTALVCLEDEERVREMARMLGGARISDRTMEHARELIGLSAGEE